MLPFFSDGESYSHMCTRKSGKMSTKKKLEVAAALLLLSSACVWTSSPLRQQNGILRGPSAAFDFRPYRLDMSLLCLLGLRNFARILLKGKWRRRFLSALREPGVWNTEMLGNVSTMSRCWNLPELGESTIYIAFASFARYVLEVAQTIREVLGAKEYQYETECVIRQKTGVHTALASTWS